MRHSQTATRKPRAKFYLAAMLAVTSCLIAPFSLLAEEGKVEIPLRKVVLFNSGVAFFEHAGTVENAATAEFKFSVDDINDLLMSLVVQDADGGQVSTVSYASKDPIEKTLKSFAIDLTTSPSLSQLLGQVRGERVVIEEGASTKTGLIVGIEKRMVPAGEEQVVEAEFVNLLTDDGLASVRLDSVGTIRLENKKLDGEFRKALALLASGHATDKKAVTIDLLGEGKRRIKVGYIQETPIWKTTYRLVLSEEEKPFLQGWAIVENTTETDWNSVRLSLVSGRPISFVMNLYDPIYVPRPMVAPKLYAALGPQVYDQDLGENELLFRSLARKRGGVMGGMGGMGMGGGAIGGMGGGMGGMPAPAAEPARTEKFAAGAFGLREEGEAAHAMNLRDGAASMAQSSDVGELFQYAIDTPVNLPRQKSAMLPIVNADIEAEKISIYNPHVQAKHPLCGLKITNTTDLHLMQGPITVFDGGTFAGDARIEALPPKATRLISYALDLDTEVALKQEHKPANMVSVRIEHGTLRVDRKLEKAAVYTVKNSGKKTKKVLIEKPLEPDWKLVAPEKPEEETRKEYRFLVEAEPGVPAGLTVKQEQIQSQTIGLNNLDDPTIGFFITAKIVPEEVKQVLRAIMKVKGEMARLSRQRAEIVEQISEFSKDQSRIRDNMARLDRTSDLYKRYVKKFGDQEDEIETLREKTKELEKQEEAKRQELENILKEAK